MSFPTLNDYKKDKSSIDSQVEEYFLSKGLVTDKQMLSCLLECSVTENPLGKTLVTNNFISQDLLIKSMLEISPDSLEDEELMLTHIPNSILINLKTKIAAETIKDVFVATYQDHDLVEFVLSKFFPNQKINFIECSLESIERYLDKLGDYGEDDEMTLEQLLRICVSEGVSDIHINPKRDSYTILVRKFGVRELFHEGEIEEYQIMSSRIKDKANIDMAERRVPQDGGFNFEHDGRLIDLRVATVVQTHGETIVMRILDPRNADRKLDELGIAGVESWRKGASNHNGMCLICGGTGSGKTTTLNSTLKELDKLGKAIFTAEDPVEYQIPYIVQCNMNDSVGYDYARALKSFMRSDPDVLIVGEIRDEVTARNAVKAAETGHLVFATMHTNTILGAFSRFRDIGVPPHELKDILRSVLCQTLIRTICKFCNGDGCIKCSNSGYGGRAIVSECYYFNDKSEVGYVLEKEVELWETIMENAYSKLEQGLTKFEELDRVFGERASQITKYEIMRNILVKHYPSSDYPLYKYENTSRLSDELDEKMVDWKKQMELIFELVASNSISISEIADKVE